MLEAQILQISTEGVIFRNKEKVIIKLQYIKDSGIDTD